jgi:hypothetical protein
MLIIASCRKPKPENSLLHLDQKNDRFPAVKYLLAPKKLDDASITNKRLPHTTPEKWS